MYGLRSHPGARAARGDIRQSPPSAGGPWPSSNRKSQPAGGECPELWTASRVNAGVQGQLREHDDVPPSGLAPSSDLGSETCTSPPVRAEPAFRDALSEGGGASPTAPSEVLLSLIGQNRVMVPSLNRLADRLPGRPLDPPGPLLRSVPGAGTPWAHGLRTARMRAVTNNTQSTHQCGPQPRSGSLRRGGHSTALSC